MVEVLFSSGSFLFWGMEINLEGIGQENREVVEVQELNTLLGTLKWTALLELLHCPGGATFL